MDKSLTLQLYVFTVEPVLIALFQLDIFKSIVSYSIAHWMPVYSYILVLGRLIDSSINNRLSVMFSDYRFVRSVIDESNCFCACASISLSIYTIHSSLFLFNK